MAKANPFATASETRGRDVLETIDKADNGEAIMKSKPESSDPGEITLDDVRGIEIEAVVGGALQTILFGEGTNPADVKGFLRSLDSGAKFREDFPARGQFGGKRDTKQATAIVLNVDVKDTGKFIFLTCQNGDDINVSVSKKNADEWLSKVEALGKLGDKAISKLRAAFADKKQATVILEPSERFGVAFWTTDDGKAFLDSMTPDPPADGGKSE